MTVVTPFSPAALRLELLGLWAELEHVYGAVIVGRADVDRWDIRRLQVEVEWAERRLAVIAEGVRAGWLPAEDGELAA